jgi:proton-translocating NADH-quinone oxidoreductase chain M
MEYALLMVFVLPILSVPFVYFAGKKSPKTSALIVTLIALINIGLVLTTVPSVLNSANHEYTESYNWIPVLNKTQFTLFVDGISVSIALTSLVLIVAAALFSVNYMEGKKNLPVYYVLLSLLSVGLVGVFITSNLLLFYFCWELMLVPAYFIVGGWGYRESYRAAFKLFIFTHAGAVFVLLGIGAIYILTGTTDMFAAQAALTSIAPDIVKWVLVALTAGFAVKMAIVPVHMWLPDAHSEAPATMSALLSGVIISAGAYAIIRLSFGVVFPAVGEAFGLTFLHALTIFGVISAFFGSLIALVETDIKRIIAYSSIAHMGYVMFGISLFPIALAKGETIALATAAIAVTGTVLHLVAHAVSKGLLFLSAGAVMHQTEQRDVNEMGGLAGKMPFTAVTAATASLSIAGTPPFACFFSEAFIFVGAFEIILADGFYLLPTIFMLVATVLSLAYSLRFISKVFLGQQKVSAESVKHIIRDVPIYMKLALGILAVLVVLIGIYPTLFTSLIETVRFG